VPKGDDGYARWRSTLRQKRDDEKVVKYYPKVFSHSGVEIDIRKLNVMKGGEQE
jgi:hypothetical protein